MSGEQTKRVNIDQLDESDELMWIKTYQETDEAQQGFTAQLLHKCRQNPLVPLGATATVSALCYGVWSFMRGDRQMSQYMMRARVGAQAFTILAVVGGLLYQKPRRT